MEEIIATEEPVTESMPAVEQQEWEPMAQEETSIRDDLPEAPVKKKRRLWLIPVCLTLVLAIAGAAAWFLTAPMRQYTQAQELFDRGDYAQAQALFEELEDYEDSADQVLACRYELAWEMMTQKQYAEALSAFESLGDFQDSPQKAMKCSYILAETALEAGDLDTAIEYFTRATEEYEDAGKRRLDTIYKRGNELYFKGKTEEAQVYFDQLADYPEYNILRFEKPQEAIEYLKSLQDPIESITVAVQKMSPYYENMDYWNSAIQQSLGYQFADVIYDEVAHTVTLTPDYYPGQRIVWAWESGDFSGLSQRELDTYEKAMTLVEQAKTESEDILETERWLHDWICENVEYDSPYTYVFPEDYVGLDELTCVGAILDGKANCQGYADAFYLLGSLAGMEVHKVFGTADGGGHCWNAVRLGGWLYTVDVTFNDTYCPEPDERTYIWYNNVLDMNQYTVFGGVSQFDKMAFLADTTYTYYTQNDRVYDTLYEAVYQLLRHYRDHGPGMDYAVVDTQNLTEDDFYKAVSSNMGIAGVYSARWFVALEQYKEDTYITVWWE